MEAGLAPEGLQPAFHLLEIVLGLVLRLLGLCRGRRRQGVYNAIQRLNPIASLYKSPLKHLHSTVFFPVGKIKHI